MFFVGEPVTTSPEHALATTPQRCHKELAPPFGRSVEF